TQLENGRRRRFDGHVRGEHGGAGGGKGIGQAFQKQRGRGVCFHPRTAGVPPAGPRASSLSGFARGQRDAAPTSGRDGRGPAAPPAYSGVMYAPVIPPSTRNVEPFTYELSSLARNSAAFAISSARANRPIGMCTSRRLRRAGSASSSARCGVWTGPGQRELARLCFRSNSTAISRV